MKNYRLFIGAVATVAVLATGYALGQEQKAVVTPADTAWADFSTRETEMIKQAVDIRLQELNSGKAENMPREQAYALATGFEKGSRDPVYTRALLAKTLQEYHYARLGNRSAAQISQVADEAVVQMEAIQVMQNQRMIALLENLTKGSK